jgi:hypothetical protein
MEFEIELSPRPDGFFGPFGVVVELAPGIEMGSIITKQSAEKLGLKPGVKAYVKASSVMIGGRVLDRRRRRRASS